MSNFVDDMTDLDFPKLPLREVAEEDKFYYLRSEDWNRACQAIYDLRAKVLAASGAVVFDDSVADTNSNVRADRATSQSPIDNTKAGVTNLGSQTLEVDPDATGATGDHATIGGGNDNTASGDGACVPGGRGNVASGADSIATGANALAQGDTSRAHGPNALALRPTQDAYASGSIHDGWNQVSRLVFRGTTPGFATNESIELKFGVPGSDSPDQVFTCEDRRGYTFKVLANAVAQDGSIQACMSYEMMFSVGSGSGLYLVNGPSLQFGDDDASTWTLTASIDTSPDRVKLLFSTGASQYEVHVTARVEFVESTYVFHD